MPLVKPCLWLLMLAVSFNASAASPQTFSKNQIQTFRTWMITIVEDQIQRGANPRWHHRDCAGLVRFAVSEALADHNPAWRKANGFLGRALPPELEMSKAERQHFKVWQNADGETSHFARALPLIQQNTRFLGKTLDKIEPGDLLFFDQGDDQHVMIWTGRRIVYHNGQEQRRLEKTSDNGLRAVSFRDLMAWRDSRWQPRPDNPNFTGFFRFTFLEKPPLSISSADSSSSSSSSSSHAQGSL